MVVSALGMYDEPWECSLIAHIMVTVPFYNTQTQRCNIALIAYLYDVKKIKYIAQLCSCTVFNPIHGLC